MDTGWSEGYRICSVRVPYCDADLNDERVGGPVQSPDAVPLSCRAGDERAASGHSAWFVRDVPVRRVRSAACACSTRDNERGIPSRAAVALSDERAMSTLVW